MCSESDGQDLFGHASSHPGFEQVPFPKLSFQIPGNIGNYSAKNEGLPH